MSLHPRATPKNRRPPVRTLIACVIGAIVVGCASTSNDPPAGGDPRSLGPVDDPGGYEPGMPADGGSGAARPWVGNVLCHVLTSVAECYPDGTRSPCPTDGGAPFAPSQDGGVLVQQLPACHVRAKDSQIPTTVCMAPGPGLDNAVCRRATDCASGFECVGSPGRCRHYCCDGASSCTSGTQFCDIQRTTEQPDLTVPVCMPVRPCKLLEDDSCDRNEACSIVDDNGTTGCVTTGPARLGESCEATHCEPGLACLGEAESRSCYQLCDKRVDTPCAPGEKCRGSAPLFRNPDVGICTRP